MDKFERFLKDVADYTDSNNHTEARIKIAKYFGLNDELIKLQGIDAKAERLGYMSQELLNEVSKITTVIFRKLPKDIGKIVKSKI